MSGGITQLVAVGAQDTHLVGNPEVSFFQSSYKRHTNFSSVIERQVIQNTPAEQRSLVDPLRAQGRSSFLRLPELT
jgi:hypothetical protein